MPVLQERAEAALQQLVEQERSICSLIQQSPLLTPPGRLRAASAEPQQLWTPGTAPSLSQHAASAAAQFPQRHAGAGGEASSATGPSAEQGGWQAAVATADGPGWQPASPTAQSPQGPAGVVQEAEVERSEGHVGWRAAAEASPANLGCQTGSGAGRIGWRLSQQGAAAPAAEQAGHQEGWTSPAAARQARNGSQQLAEPLEGQAAPAAAQHEESAVRQAPLAAGEGGGNVGQHAALVAEQLAQVSQSALAKDVDLAEPAKPGQPSQTWSRAGSLGPAHCSGAGNKAQTSFDSVSARQAHLKPASLRWASVRGATCWCACRHVSASGRLLILFMSAVPAVHVEMRSAAGAGAHAHRAGCVHRWPHRAYSVPTHPHRANFVRECRRCIRQ